MAKSFDKHMEATNLKSFKPQRSASYKNKRKHKNNNNNKKKRNRKKKMYTQTKNSVKI